MVARGWNGYRNKSQHRKSPQKVSTESRPWRRKFSRRSSRDSNPRPFNHESGALTTELSPPPSVVVVDRFYIALFSALEQTHRARNCFCLSECPAFYSAFLNIHRSGVLTALAWLVSHETAAVSTRSVYTIQPCTVSLHAKPHT